MSRSGFRNTITRIKDAPESSPIAVFITEDGDYFNTVFAKTARTKGAIRAKDKTLVGVYHGGCDLHQVKKELAKYIRRS